MSPKPISDAKLAANRDNSKKSTGPRTPEGKARVHNNAVRHGLTGRTVLLPGDDRAVYRQFTDALIADLRPGSDHERQIARTIADAHWRLNRIRSVEDGMLLGDAPPGADARTQLLAGAKVFLDRSQSFLNITLYEQRIHRTIKTSMEELRRLRAEREAVMERDMPRALEHLKERLMRDLPFDPRADGFVFSTEQIETALHYEIRRKQVAWAKEHDFNLAACEKLHPPRAA